MTTRKSGILLHPTSLPSGFGVGDFGPAAYAFVDRLAEAGQGLWQILPLVPTDAGGSPYASCSAFAVDPLLLSPKRLAADGLLTEADLAAAHLPLGGRVDYAAARAAKAPLLERAFQAFRKADPPAAYTAFCAENADWLGDYTLYLALKRHFQAERAAEKAADGFAAFADSCAALPLTEERLRAEYFGASWVSFPAPLQKRRAAALRQWRERLAEEIARETFLQYECHAQWRALKAYANEKGISVIGDTPIFVAYDSADVWANQKLFRLDAQGFPQCVAGVPPDYFSETGQLWGNPLYDWKQHEKSGFSWWIARIRKALRDVDILRIDHFRGFCACWEIPFGAADARGGKWVPSPGRAIFAALRDALGDLPLIAEDLGIITADVAALRDELRLPGMRILQFAFGGDKNNSYLPHQYEKNTVVYTGTHDNDTTRGWYENASEAERDHFRRYLNVDGTNAAWDMIRLAFSSPAALAVVPLQDVLGLGSADRMNLPGTAEGNWGFAFTFDQWDAGASEGLRYLSALFGRNEGLPR